MLPLRYPRTSLVAGLVLLAAGLVTALSPGLPIGGGMFSDKFLHAAAFLFFMLWFGGVFEPRFAPLLVVGLSLYGLLIELLQSLTPTRQAEFRDLVADVAGVLLGWILSAAGLSGWCAKLESWFLRLKPRAT